MTELKFRIDSEEKKEHRVVDFNLKDKQGRSVGAIVHTAISPVHALPEDARSWYSPKGIKAPGNYFSCYIQMIKNGEYWGPGQNSKFFNSREKRQAYLEKRLNQMRKRYA